MEGREPTIQYLTQVKRDLHAKRERLLRPVQELDKEIEHITSALAVVLRNGIADEKENPLGFPIKKLKGLTQTQALLEIAKYNGGEIKALEVKPILIGAGIMRSTKNSARMIHGLIARSEAFVRIGRGHYKLKPTSIKLAAREDVSLFSAKDVQ
jgi:hypothetical protein